MERAVERRREAEPLETFSDIMNRYMDDRTRQMREGMVVVKGEGISWEQNPMSLIKPYLHPANWDKSGAPGWMVFRHYIKKHSGKHRHQGGIGIFVLQGKGYTMVDGVRYDWEEDDLIIIPVVPNGCEHEHFNLDPSKPAEWLAFIYMPILDALGNERVQVTLNPDYKGASQRVASPLPHAG
ncbi:MAG: cupin domain-containing protein [Chloroflexi bacterium]|nr:cupin domain-containing protein [Chloroflexota bacterium]